MPLARRAKKNILDFRIGLNYRAYTTKPNLRDARNVFTNQNRLETRYGYSRFNDTTLGGEILSSSFYVKSDNTKYWLAKVGTSLYSVSAVGASTAIKTGLTATTKHRAYTINNRHIIAIGIDGLFSWDGTTFTALGVDTHDDAYGMTLAGTGGTLAATTTYGVKLAWYSTTLGVESEASAAVSKITTASGTSTLDLNSYDSAASNPLFDKLRIYMADETANGLYLFIAEIDPATTTTYLITDESTSTQVPTTTNSSPLAGGGQYFTGFNNKLVYTGSNTFQSDVFFSNDDAPDFYDFTSTNLTINAPNNGPITGIATGLYNGDSLDPYLVIFKERSTHIYSEIGGLAKFVTIDTSIGCVAHDTIIVKDGVVYFLSDRGWRAIHNGNIIKDKTGGATTLANGDIDDIFTFKGFAYEVNRSDLKNSFSAYYPALDQYITWVSEGITTGKSKQYVYEQDYNTFKAYEFSINATCSMLSEDVSGNQAVIFGDANGYLYTHSLFELRTDIDSSESDVEIPVSAVLWWLPERGDFDATYNFRELLVRAFSNEAAITVKAWPAFEQGAPTTEDLTFSGSGFVLDVSLLDEGYLSDSRGIVTARTDINLVAESILIGFYQTAANVNIGLLTLQFDMSKNGNRNY